MGAKKKPEPLTTYPNGLAIGDKAEMADLRVGDRVAVWQDHDGQWGCGAWRSATVTSEGVEEGGRRPTARLDPKWGNCTYHPSPSGFTTRPADEVFVYRARRLA